MVQTAEVREGSGNSFVPPVGGGEKRGTNSIAHFLLPFFMPSFETRIGDRFPLHVTRAIKGRERLTGSEKDVIAIIAFTDWSVETLDIGNPQGCELAARATALGAVLCYPFGNFYAVAAHPCDESVRYVNESKGRPVNQVGSATTTKDLLLGVFDWDQVPDNIGRGKIISLIDAFYQMGPFGFRGPAREGMHSLLTSREGDLVTTQIIAPGYDCPSNEVIKRILALTGEKYIFITSANISSNVTGKEEPAHYRIAGIQEDFGMKAGYIMVGGPDKTTNYPDYLPMSTSIIGFQRIGYDQESQRPTLSFERHGSLHEIQVREIAAANGFSLTRGPKAQTRLPLRVY